MIATVNFGSNVNATTESIIFVPYVVMDSDSNESFQQPMLSPPTAATVEQFGLAGESLSERKEWTPL